jgi:hypothetical protein
MLRKMLLAPILVLCASFAQPLWASDHADPAWLSTGKQEANLTGLFFFSKNDRYVLILDTRPSLTAAPPYNLAPYSFAIHVDTHSRLSFPAEGPAVCTNTPAKRGTSNVQLINGNFCRYGGTVDDPTGIRPDVSFRFTLDNDPITKPAKMTIEGGQFDRSVPVQYFTDGQLGQARDPRAVWVYSGVRDDPFIFPKFFNANVITMVVSVPKAAFRTDHPDWLIWAESRYAGGDKIDHVGRSNRTQLGRFDILNTLEPSDHVKALREAADGRKQVQDFLKETLRPLANLNQLSGFVMRSYDYAPDVMIYSTRYPEGFPNGRRLEDDVSETTCQWGDCPLHENSYIDSATFPRATVNDKALLPDFPYLAEHWPWRPQPATGSPWHWFRTHLLWPIVLLLVAAYLIRRAWRLACARLRASTVD